MPTAPERTAHGPYGELIKSYSFGDFVAGEKVDVDGRFLSNRVQWMTDWKWEIIAFVTNIENGAQWVEIYGGAPNKWAHTSACAPEAVVKVDNRHR